MQDLNNLHHINSTELNTTPPITHKYSKSPQKSKQSGKNHRKIRDNLDLDENTATTPQHAQK